MIYNILELGLIILICLFLLWLDLSHISSRLNVDMMAELTDLEYNTDLKLPTPRENLYPLASIAGDVVYYKTSHNRKNLYPWHLPRHC